MPTTTNSSTNSNNLSDFLNFESKQRENSSSSSDATTNIGHHALNQLLESKLGDELTCSAQKLSMMLHTNNSHHNAILLEEEEVTHLMDTRAFQQMNAQIIQECPTLLSSLLLSSTQGTEDDNIAVGVSSNKKSREESPAAATTTNKPPTAAAAAATSFSLFDLMDSQKGAFLLPPRIMAQQVIDAHQHHVDTTKSTDNATMQDSSMQEEAPNNNNNNDNNHNKTALELLEQAQDMEDLSPDIQSWERIQSILYRGLVSNNNNNHHQTNNNFDERRRYLNVHKSIFEKCQHRGGGGGMFRCQSWGVTLNIVGFILSLSNNKAFVDNQQQSDDEPEVVDLDLYWDSCHHLLSSLSSLAMEFVTSSIGHEREMERMIFGLCSILCNDVSSCILAMMEPMAGWFEVWTRFVAPTRLLATLKVSGLGEVVLRRCESRGRNAGSVRLHELLCQRNDGGDDYCPSLKDMEESNYLQSLSILRVIVSRCGATSLGSMGSIFCCSSNVASPPSFLSADGGIVATNEVQAMLETKEEQSSSIEEQNEIRRRVLRPFRGVLLLRESSPGLVDADLEELCAQTVSLIEQE